MDREVLARARHGVIEVSALREMGLSQVAITRRAQAGRLHRVHHGVFAVGRPDLSAEGRCLAAALACGPEARVFKRSGARLWELRGGGISKIDIIAPRSVRPQAGIRLHRPRSLDEVDFTEHLGIPITTVARTLLDCAAPGLGIDIGAMVNQAIVRQLLDAREVWDVLARHPTHRGARRLDRAMREEHPVTRSGLEDAMVALLRRAGLGGFRTNWHVWAGDELLEVDFFWRDAGVVVEVDSARYHASRWQQRKDAEKTAKLRAAGYLVLRVWDAEINRAPERVVAAIAAALGLQNVR
jgi:very-short-patch-repair endonuclease